MTTFLIVDTSQIQIMESYFLSQNLICKIGDSNRHPRLNRAGFASTSLYSIEEHFNIISVYRNNRAWIEVQLEIMCNDLNWH